MWLWFGPMPKFRKVAVFSERLLVREATVSVADGAVTPMPTLVLAVAPFTSLILPSTSESLWSTCAWEPIAVALVRLLAPTLAAFPIAVLRAPSTLVLPALNPKKEFLPPVVFAWPA